MHVKISQPSARNNQRNPMPYKFLAVGTILGNEDLHHVRGELTDGTTSVRGELVRFVALERRGRARQKFQFSWAFLFDTNFTTQGSVRLTVTGMDADDVAIDDLSKEVNFYVQRRAQFVDATIAYPEDGHKITSFELDSFMPFGGSDMPVTGVTIGPPEEPGTPAVFYSWDPTSGFWYAVFTDLRNLPGFNDEEVPEYVLTVATDDTPTQKEVTVEAD
jgi:hypothetical protein